jgi:hypothetical protein
VQRSERGHDRRWTVGFQREDAHRQRLAPGWIEERGRLEIAQRQDQHHDERRDEPALGRAEQQPEPAQVTGTRRARGVIESRGTLGDRRGEHAHGDHAVATDETDHEDSETSVEKVRCRAVPGQRHADAQDRGGKDEGERRERVEPDHAPTPANERRAEHCGDAGHDERGQQARASSVPRGGACPA